MRVTRVTWHKRMGNLFNRRSSGGKVGNRSLPTYCEMLSRVHVGKSVLDVGCGSMGVKKCLSKAIRYTGIDAFPINDQVIRIEIEHYTGDPRAFDTVLCFATLDGLRDADMAIRNMKNLAKDNVVFLTGVNIPPDACHTFEITEEYLNEQMEWPIAYKEMLTERVMLVSYARP